LEAASQPCPMSVAGSSPVRQARTGSRRCIDFPFDLRFWQSGIAYRGRLGKVISTAPIGPGASAIPSNGAAGPSGPNACLLYGYSSVNSMIGFSARASRAGQPSRG
jgi:hypothetical protein